MSPIHHRKRKHYYEKKVGWWSWFISSNTILNATELCWQKLSASSSSFVCVLENKASKTRYRSPREDDDRQLYNLLRPWGRNLPLMRTLRPALLLTSPVSEFFTLHAYSPASLALMTTKSPLWSMRCPLSARYGSKFDSFLSWKITVAALLRTHASFHFGHRRTQSPMGPRGKSGNKRKRKRKPIFLPAARKLWLLSLLAAAMADLYCCACWS